MSTERSRGPLAVRLAAAAALLDGFSERTGVTAAGQPRRYLWTDAFAVCTCLALHELTGDSRWLERTRKLVAQVHRVLGRHRPDDERTGWLSGLPEAEGERHPTIAGLRIGKPLPERRPDEAPNHALDWDRDGQYYHYLTRWQHALVRTAAVTRELLPLAHAAELASAAHRAFAHGPPGRRQLYWKLSIDLSEPAVASMGHHDALDGLITVAELYAAQVAVEHAGSHATHGSAGGASPSRAPLKLDRPPPTPTQFILAELADMCAGRGWATADALGLGMLLCDALLLARLVDRVPALTGHLLARVLHDAARSLDLATTGRIADGPAHERLAFRELGLAIGLSAVERLVELQGAAGSRAGAQTPADLERLAAHLPLRAELESFWLEPRHQQAASWREHEDINAVMLATSLVPDGYLA